MQPDRVLLAVMDDRMIAKGLVLHWVTAFFQDYLATESLDDLVALLRKTRLDTRLMEFFPPHKRTLAEFDEHFEVGTCSSLAMPLSHTLDMIICVQLLSLSILMERKSPALASLGRLNTLKSLDRGGTSLEATWLQAHDNLCVK